MNKPLRVIPGAVSSDSVRAVILTPAPPTVAQVRVAATSVVTNATLVELTPTGGKLGAEFTRFGLRVYQLECGGLSAHTEYHLVVKHGALGAVRANSRRVPFRTLPTQLPDAGLSFILASCYYQDARFDASQRYLDALRRPEVGKPAFKLLIGDQLYLDIAPDQRDFSDGYRESVTRYVDYFWSPGYGEVLERLPTFTTFDDHEYWNNFPETQLWLSRTWGGDYDDYKRAGIACLDIFQAPLNPPALSAKTRTFVFDAAGISFFVADCRTLRQKHSGPLSAMMPESDLVALETWAAGLEAPGVLIVGQPLWMDEGNRFDYNPPDFQDQYNRIWIALLDSPYEILVLTGDVHHSRLLELHSGTPARRVFELCCSPANHIPKSLNIRRQGQSDIEFPEKRSLTPTGRSVVLDKYFFGTDSTNTLAHINFRSPTPGRVQVSCGFIDFLDTQTMGPAVSRPADSTSQRSTEIQSVYHVCKRTNVFELRKR